MLSKQVIDGDLMSVAVTKDGLILNTYTLSNYFLCNNSGAGINGGFYQMFFCEVSKLRGLII